MFTIYYTIKIVKYKVNFQKNFRDYNINILRMNNDTTEQNDMLKKKSNFLFNSALFYGFS